METRCHLSHTRVSHHSLLESVYLNDVHLFNLKPTRQEPFLLLSVLAILSRPRYSEYYWHTVNVYIVLVIDICWILDPT